MSFSVRAKVTAADVAHGERSATRDDFRAHAPSGTYIYMPCREPWTARAVDIVVGPQQVLDKNGKPVRNKKGEVVTESASAWLLKHQRVEQMAWVPGEPALIHDRLVVGGGWIERPEVTCLNMYRPPQIKLGDPNLAGPWLDHVHKVFPDDANHILHWLAQRVQSPEIKINHALVLGSETFGIGKDTMLTPIRQAVGPWNFYEVTPTDMLGPFNPFVKSSILRINEARDLGEINRFTFYDRLKSYTASPPEVLSVNEKHLRQYTAFNCVGVIITTNHRTDGIYLPADDRRNYIAWSERTRADFDDDYWNGLNEWYERGGHGHVAAYLHALDISAFSPKAPPPKTTAFWEIVTASESPEDAELADAIDRLGAKRHPGEVEPGTTNDQRRPDVITLLELVGVQGNEMIAYMLEHKHRRATPHRLNRCDYRVFRNTSAKDGLWRINGSRQAVYVKATLPPSARKAAVAAYLGGAMGTAAGTLD
jgi:hypothetical protein